MEFNLNKATDHGFIILKSTENPKTVNCKLQTEN